MRLHTPGDDYAADSRLLLGDGNRILLRPLGPNDRDGLTALFDRMSPASRHQRFFSPKRELTSAELAYLTDIDHVHHEAFAAVERRDGAIVGVCRYVQLADRPLAAEVAVEVADDLQGVGIGTALAKQTVRRARANGLALLTATTLWGNRPARALLRRLDFRACGSDGGVIELELKLHSLRWGSSDYVMNRAEPSASRSLRSPKAAARYDPALERLACGSRLTGSDTPAGRSGPPCQPHEPFEQNDDHLHPRPRSSQRRSALRRA